MDGNIETRARGDAKTARRLMTPLTRKRPRLLPLLLPLLLIGGTLAFVVARPWLNGRGALRLPAPPAPFVGISVARAGALPIMREGLGNVVPMATVVLRPQVNGILVAVDFHEGQMVHKGDLLAEIDPRPFQVALAQAQGQLAHDQALLAGAEADLARYQKLRAQDSIARQQVDTQFYLVQEYQGTVAADQAAVDNARLNLGYARITAPITGRIGLRAVDAGNYVQTTDVTGIATITEQAPITVEFTLPEDDLPPLLAAYVNGHKLRVSAYDRTDRQRLASGVLTAVDSQIDPTTGTIRLRAMFDNREGHLYPNQFVNARITLGTITGTVLVPDAAVMHGPQGNFVWRLDLHDRVWPVDVRLAARNGATRAIAGGLAPGARVVVDGADRLSPGETVRPQPAPAGQ